ncbi:MAG: chloride channel protein, partial [Dinghuibacter sp.]|nr:chloride channel protein [Dinghuibacter sp.]
QEKGIGMVLKAIAKRSSFIPTSNTYKHVVASSLTVGLGGSAGLEAPIVATGSSYGSFFGRINDLNYQERTLMIACGAAAGISAVFNAPIAGVIFAIEVLLAETVVSHFIPLIISSVAGVLCSKVILQESILFNFVLKQDFNYRNVPYYILLGIMAGFVSLYYAKSFKKTEHWVQQLRWNPFLKAAAGGLMLALFFYFFPPLFGEGYQSVSHLANSNIDGITSNNLFDISRNNFSLLIFIGSIMLLKPIAAAVTIGSGGNGGNFAPSLFVGSSLGFFFSKLANSSGWLKLPEGNFTLVGMAGVLSGVMYCPLTAVFLIAEITNGYGLFIPLMIVSSLSFFIVKHFEPYSMELKKLALEGEVFTHKKEQNILTSIQLESILAENYQSISSKAKLSALVEVIKKSDKNIFAVIDDKEKFVGIVELNDIKKLLFDIGKHETTPIQNITKKPREIIFIDEPMKQVMEKFDTAQTWYLPVLSRDRKFISFISKTRLFEKYREIIMAQSDLYEN